MNSSVYGSVVFDLTLFKEVTRPDYVIRDIKGSVIDSCIKVIVGLYLSTHTPHNLLLRQT